MNTSNPVGGVKRREKEKVTVTSKENITPASTIEYEGKIPSNAMHKFLERKVTYNLVNKVNHISISVNNHQNCCIFYKIRVLRKLWL